MTAMAFETSDQLISEINRFFKNASQTYLPGIRLDTVIFSFHDNSLNVLLLHYWDNPYHWLPGGYIEKTEDIDEAAYRILQDRTSLTDIYLDQFYTSGSTSRADNDAEITMLKKRGVHLPPGNWLEQRFISVAYYALIDNTHVAPASDPLVSEVKWFNVAELPELLYDYRIIIEKALQRLQLDLDQKVLGVKLMPEEFTMAELQRLYESIHQTKLDRTSFQRKILSLNTLERLEKKYTGKAHKSPFLYRFIKAGSKPA